MAYKDRFQIWRRKELSNATIITLQRRLSLPWSRWTRQLRRNSSIFTRRSRRKLFVSTAVYFLINGCGNRVRVYRL
ncbi:hypothetical protein CICLE_v10033239mg [Citrus x clementina]|uniref:Uncharacterized protein n=1 Tax=Citrus clementina TaxID=85681 RepID=V4VG63_CITCL|nr:hypothetical protein CICLE_v10033239mg [Citrus x clementina]